MFYFSKVISVYIYISENTNNEINKSNKSTYIYIYKNEINNYTN